MPRSIIDAPPPYPHPHAAPVPCEVDDAQNSVDASLGGFLDRFLKDVRHNPANAAILDRWDALALPQGWLVAGCLFQTVWNLKAGRPPQTDLHDYDLFYFDPQDLSDTAEQAVQAQAERVLSDLGLRIEVANQARVHHWYAEHFGRPYPALTSSEDGIRRFLVRETCVAVRPGACHAPYGLQGVYAGTLTPNPLTPYPELYAAKVASYRARWPQLRDTAC